ncbi:MAG: 16S rRNA (cytosine(967)-C(5))-methyltransferase RsmB [candidate division Zixibacteria bacterium]|nr:16S rRNA (cytosine(967)-C(5))-methyltransferase RsmB [candidate division Zixibacteria bacterium]
MYNPAVTGRGPRRGRPAGVGPRDRRPLPNPFGQGQARAVAYDLARRAVAGADPFDQLWHSDPGFLQLAPRDRALAIHLSAGVLRHLRRLDAQARLLTDGKSDELSDAVQWILRLGLFQVLDCDRIPAHAAVSTAVDAAKVAAHQGIAGLVNAVLRRAVREKPQLVAFSNVEATGPDDLGAWTDRLSMPEWLVSLLFDRFGVDAASRIARWANNPPAYYFRLARGGAGLSRLEELVAVAGLGTVRPHPDFPEYVAVSTAALTSGSPLFSEPLGWVQNPAAGLVVRLLDPQPGETVIDLFAAPGGKSLAIAECVGPSGQVLAVDKSESRLQRVLVNKMRMGFEQILPVMGDVTGLGQRPGSRVLADVPCSALGTLPKNPEVRWTKTPADVDRLARSQRIWLAAASSHVEPGGVLVYSTCTFPPRENEQVVTAFLSGNPTFRFEPADPSLVPPRYISPEGYLRTVPPDDGLDGVFAARFRRLPS